MHGGNLKLINLTYWTTSYSFSVETPQQKHRTTYFDDLKIRLSYNARITNINMIAIIIGWNMSTFSKIHSNEEPLK